MGEITCNEEVPCKVHSTETKSPVSLHSEKDINKPCGNCQKDHDGRTLCDFSHQPSKTWEEELIPKNGEYLSIRSLISYLLTSERERLVGEIEGMRKRFYPNEVLNDVFYEDMYRTSGFNFALDEVIKIIKRD